MDAERIEQRRLGPGPTWAIWQCLDSPRDATVGQILSGALAELGACLQGKADIIAATLTHPDEESSRALAYRANRPADGFVVLAYKNNVAVFYSVDRLGGPKEDSGYVFSGQAYAAGSGVPGLIQTMERAGRTVLRLDVPRCLLNIFGRFRVSSGSSLNFLDRVEVESSEVEEDSVSESSAISEAAGRFFEPLDSRIGGF